MFYQVYEIANISNQILNHFHLALCCQHPYADPFEPAQLYNRAASVEGWPERLAKKILPFGLLRIAFGSFSKAKPVVSGPKAFVVQDLNKRSAGSTVGRSASQHPSQEESSLVSEGRTEVGGSATATGLNNFTQVLGQSAGQSEHERLEEQDQPVRVPKSAGELWTLARVAVWSGRVRRLPASSSYDLVSSTFSALFPLEFDCVVPIFNCGAVESLLLQWNRTMTSLEDVSWCLMCNKHGS